jgi:hypothetical protein
MFWIRTPDRSAGDKVFAIFHKAVQALLAQELGDSDEDSDDIDDDYDVDVDDDDTKVSLCCFPSSL